MEPVRINDEFFKELCEIWSQARKDKKHPISAVEDRIKQKLNIAFRASLDRTECLFLFGRQSEGRQFEQGVGWLKSFVPGIVILSPDGENCRPELSGLLERCGPGDQQLFNLRSFAPPYFDASLSIWPSTFPHSARPFFKICPVWISWDIGAGMSDSYLRLGIDPDRWNNVLKPWLDRWLPISK